ncbi:MAG: Gfo/Idh/MocA family oxidoreductase [Gammaproteobacteria bacterium]|nr:Gfo/Idh/MocA family oxidoreductase [Gammaproteobacteria bacterium]
MSIITTAVIGAGYLGKYHVEKYAQLPGSELIAVVDSNPQTARDTADRYGVEALTDYRDLLERVDAVSIVVPTHWHFEIAQAFLETGSHVLLEKPITTTVAQAQQLVDLARDRQRVLQVGHLERFNKAILDLGNYLNQPLFIETHRLAPFKPRGTDVSVVLDLMIHDIDIILTIVDSPLVHIDASGAAVLSDTVDIANARLKFANGCVANVTASRISMKTERKMRIFQNDAYLSVDFHNRELAIFRKGQGELYPGVPNIENQCFRYQEDDALKTEIELFLKTIREGTQPIVSGDDGKQALEAAIQITELLARQDNIHDG